MLLHWLPAARSAAWSCEAAVVAAREIVFLHSSHMAATAALRSAARLLSRAAAVSCWCTYLHERTPRLGGTLIRELERVFFTDKRRVLLQRMKLGELCFRQDA